MGQVFQSKEKLGTLTKTGNTTVQLSPSVITLGAKQYSTGNLVCDLSTDLDTGSVQSSKSYYVYAVVVSGSVALKASLSSTGPLGFGNFEKVGALFVGSNLNISEAVNFNGQFQGNWVRAEGNGGESITANVTDIPFTEVTDTASAWDGDSYTVQKNNSVISLSGSVFRTSSATHVYDLYKNNTLYKRLVTTDSAGSVSNQQFTYINSRGEFTVGDSLSIRTNSSSTLSNDSIYHYLNIVEEYPDDLVWN